MQLNLRVMVGPSRFKAMRQILYRLRLLFAAKDQETGRRRA